MREGLQPGITEAHRRELYSAGASRKEVARLKSLEEAMNLLSRLKSSAKIQPSKSDSIVAVAEPDQAPVNLMKEHGLSSLEEEETSLLGKIAELKRSSNIDEEELEELYKELKKVRNGIRMITGTKKEGERPATSVLTGERPKPGLDEKKIISGIKTLLGRRPKGLMWEKSELGQYLWELEHQLKWRGLDKFSELSEISKLKKDIGERISEIRRQFELLKAVDAVRGLGEQGDIMSGDMPKTEKGEAPTEDERKIAERKKANDREIADAKRRLAELEKIERKLPKEEILIAEQKDSGRIILIPEHQIEGEDTLEVILGKSLAPNDLEDALIERKNRLKEKLESTSRFKIFGRKKRENMEKELSRIETELELLKLRDININS